MCGVGWWFGGPKPGTYSLKSGSGKALGLVKYAISKELKALYGFVGRALIGLLVVLCLFAAFPFFESLLTFYKQTI